MKFFDKPPLIVLLFLLLTMGNLLGQEVFVEDGSNGDPLENVAVFSENRRNYILTDSLGRASLSNFPKDGKINFYLSLLV